MCAAWIGFAGAVTGGLLTLIGVLITIRYYKTQEKRNDDKERRSGELICYRFLLSKVDILRKAYELYEDEKKRINKITIHAGTVFTHDENLFLYERIHYLDHALNDDELRTIMAFMAQLCEYEAVRLQCIKEIDDKVHVYSSGKYAEILTNCYKRLFTSEDAISIADILIRLESSLGLSEEEK